MYENRKHLIEYIPHIIRDVQEYKALLIDGEQPQITLLWNGLENALNDQFISDATEYGIKRWEKILGIYPKATATLEERKFTVLARINEELPFTMTMLKAKLEILCGAEGEGYVVSLIPDEYKLIVKVALVAVSNYQDVADLLDRIVPANMIIELSIIYNRYSVLANFTHGHLAAYTHYQLRNEVLE